jgi:hypothetical protein
VTDDFKPERPPGSRLARLAYDLFAGAMLAAGLACFVLFLALLTGAA